MTNTETKRLSPKRLAGNNDAFAALQRIDGYTPANKAYDLGAGTSLAAALKAATDAEAQATAAAKAARDNAAAAEWAMHNYVLGAKDQIAAQFGKSSNEFQSMGMKKKTEYKRPAKKAPKSA